MSTPEAYADLQSGAWASRNPFGCPCKASGWMLSDFDTWHRCPLHGRGVPHPEDEDAPFDAEAHRRQITIEAYRAYRADLAAMGIDSDRFLQLVNAEVAVAWMAAAKDAAEKKVPFDAKARPSSVYWIDAAEDIYNDAWSAKAHADAVKAGFSCRLEAALAAESEVERGLRRGENPSTAERDRWYPR